MTEKWIKVNKQENRESRRSRLKLHKKVITDLSSENKDREKQLRTKKKEKSRSASKVARNQRKKN